MKNAKKVVAEQQTSTETVQPEVVASKPQTIQVKPGIKSRGARQAWYELASAYDGKTVDEFMAAAVAHGAVSTYTARSKHAGSPHSARGYLRGLVRRGWVTLV